MPTMVPDRSNDPKRVPGSYMSEVKKAQAPIYTHDLDAFFGASTKGEPNPNKIVIGKSRKSKRGY